MNASPRVEDARLAFLPIFAEDTYSIALQGGPGAALSNPAPDARLEPAWKVRASLTGSDAIFRSGPVKLANQTVFYGWVLESADLPGEFVIVVRGTIGLVEWLEDAEFATRKHPVAGNVEDGFFGIYESMGVGASRKPAADDLANLLKDATTVTVVGHSLGSALATYLAFDLAAPERLGSRTRAVLFASPRAGDAAFGEALRMRIPDHRAYAYQYDLVPDIPRGFGFTPVPGTIVLPASHPAISVKFSLACFHHALTYASLLDSTSLASFPAIDVDLPFVSCVTAT